MNMKLILNESSITNLSWNFIHDNMQMAIEFEHESGGRFGDIVLINVWIIV